MPEVSSVSLIATSVKVDEMDYDHIVAIEPTFGLVGIVDVFTKSRRSASICRLFVPPAYRRQHIGRRLVERCISEAECAHCESLGLVVGAKNRDACDFYRKLGFTCAYEYDDGQLLYVIMI